MQAPEKFNVRTWRFGTPSADWSVRVEPDGTAERGPYTLGGPCPICSHHVINTVGGHVTTVPGVSKAEVTTAETRSVRLLVECNCGENHEGKDAESLGCGAFGFIVAAWPIDKEGEVDAGTGDLARTLPATFRQEPAELADREWAREARSLSWTALTAIRSSAAKWAGSIGGIVGVFTVAALVKGRDDVSELTPSFRWAVISILLLGLAATLVAMYSANEAAAGRPVDVWQSGESVRAAYLKTGEEAAARLRLAQILTAWGAVLVVIAVVVLWTGTEKSPDPTNLVQLTRTDGTTVCGTLESDGPLAVVLRRPNADADDQFRRTEVDATRLPRDAC